MSEPTFELTTPAEDSEFLQYRPLNVAALISLVLGCLSFTACLSPAFWPLAVLAILAGVVALRSIARRDGMALGRSAALAGLLLGTLFLTMGVASLLHDRASVYREARQFADGWLKLLSDGHWQAAHQATIPRYKRTLTALSVEHGYEQQPKLQEQWEIFQKNNPPVGKLHQSPGGFQFRWLANSEQRYLKKQRAVVLRYEISLPGQAPQQVDLLLMRDAPWMKDPASWMLSGMARADN